MIAAELADDLVRRMNAFNAGDPSLVMEERALDNATALWTADHDGESISLPTVSLLAWLSWFRYQSLPDGQEADDFYRATRMFGLMADMGAGDVPDVIRWYLSMPRDTQAPDSQAKAVGAGIWLERATYRARYTDAPITVRQVIEKLPDGQFAVAGDYSALATHVSDLGTSLQMRFHRTHVAKDMDDAVNVLRLAIQRTPAGHPQRWLPLTNLGVALEDRFRDVGAVRDLDDAVAAAGQAVAAAPIAADRAVCLANLAVALTSRFHHGGLLSDLDQAVEARRQAAELVADGAGRARRLTELASDLLVRVERTQLPADLAEVIQVSRAAIAAWPDKSGPGECLANLGVALYLSFERSGNLGDLDEAVAAMRQAAEKAGDGLRKAVLLTRLGAALMGRFRRTGNLADLEEAIALGREALAASPRPERRPAVLSNLAGALIQAFEAFGRLPDLEEAVASLREALDHTPPDSPDRAALLTNLASALRNRYDRVGDIADLDEVIARSRAAVDAVPPGQLRRAEYESALSGRLRVRFQRLRESADLDEAVAIGRHAVESMPLTGPGSAERLSILFGALRIRFESAGNPADLEEAIAAGQQAVDVSPADDPARPGRLANLAVGLWIRFEHAGDLADLEQALELGRQAIEATPPQHPRRAQYLSAQGRRHRVRFECLGLAEDAAAAIESWQEATRVQAADTYSRVEAAYHWGRQAAVMGDWPQAARGYAVAVELMPLLAWRGAARRSREQMLSDWPSLACDAAACAVMAQQSELGLQLLEQGRGVLWSDLLAVHADLTALHQVADGLATRLKACRASLDELAVGAEPGNPRLADRRMALAREWDELVGQVRALDGFEDFLRPPRPEALRAAAANGPVAVINVSQWRCDALIVTAEGVRVEELPELSAENVTSMASDYLRVLHQLDQAVHDLYVARDRLDHGDRGFDTIMQYTKAKQAVQDAQRERDQVLAVVLAWLWDEICAPILTALSLVSTPEPGQSWPRLWWCPTGLLTLLPLHAAGHYDARGQSSGRTVLDRVVSSYAPTLRALLAARRPLDSQPDSDRMLVVALEETPGQLPLAEVARDRELLTSLFARRQTVLAGQAATWAAVREELPRHRWVHFSCHGGQDLADPSRGGLLLHDRLLSVADISTEDYRGEFSFLSACMTATGGVDVPDEVITLAAAMHYTGYRHVIGTLWSVHDTTAADIAERVYTELTSAGRLDATRSAHALHSAIRGLRDDDHLPPSSWAPFAHTGP